MNTRKHIWLKFGARYRDWKNEARILFNEWRVP
jgi:hypothetical protein